MLGCVRMKDEKNSQTPCEITFNQHNFVKFVEPEKHECQFSVTGRPECCLTGYKVEVRL